MFLCVDFVCVKKTKNTFILLRKLLQTFKLNDKIMQLLFKLRKLVIT